MRPHHEEAIARAKERLLAQPDVLAVLVGGSIAKKVEHENSDVDLIVVVTDEGWRSRKAGHAVAFLWRDICNYKGGYVEGRFVSRSFVLEAAERGSEPTRYSFVAAYPVHCVAPEIEAALPRIPVYPEHERQARIESFLAQMQLNRWFFWGEANRRNDHYLKIKAAAEIVLFGGRLILAHNRMLFPCQKRLMECLAAAPQKPEQTIELANAFLTALTDESKEAFCKAIIGFADWGKPDLLSRFLEDVEMSWFTRQHAVAEW